MSLKILLIDDHPLTIGAYRQVIQDSLTENSHSSTVANNAEQAYNAITQAENSHFNLAIIDHGLPAYEEKELKSGLDIALLLRERMPNCNIVMITAHTEMLIIYDIYKLAKPEGFIIKSELTPQLLAQTIKIVTEGDTYRSPIVSNCVKEIWKKELMVDDINRQILFFLSKGYKMKEVEEIVFLSGSAVQKRIASMKKVFEVSSDGSLVKEAIKQGFL
jgi:DNA-binding NarL/FixJ family response regulator